MPINTNTNGCVHVHMAWTQEFWFSSYAVQEHHINFRGENNFYLFRKVTVPVYTIDIAVLSETYFFVQFSNHLCWTLKPCKCLLKIILIIILLYVMVIIRTKWEHGKTVYE